MKELRKRYWYELALCASSLSLIYSPLAYTAENSEPLIAIAGESNANANKDVYTINFNNVSIIELIRFTSKISGLNFVFEEADLQFSVTVVSEEAVSAKSMLSALSQVLRMHDLSLLEQGSNVLITNSKRINQIPKIVSAEVPNAPPEHSALVTRVFRIKNANVSSVANIIRPMISDTALIEVSVETRQLIVTDITTNVDQIADLLMSLDTPHTSLEVDSYTVKNIAPAALILLTDQILAPFKEGNPLVLVSQPETNAIYVVSTPYLIERTLSLMEDLDIPPAASPVTPQGGKGNKSSFFVYHPLHRSGADLDKELHQLGKNLKESGLADPDLLTTLDSMKWTSSTNSLVFTGDPQSIQKIQTVLQTMDVAAGESNKSSFFVYHPIYRSGKELDNELKNLASSLTESGLADPHFLAALRSMKWTPTTNSLVFTGDPQSIQKIQAVLQVMDSASSSVNPLENKSSFFVYHPENRPGDELDQELSDLAKSLTESGLADPDFLATLHSMKWTSSTNSLVFTGDAQSIQKVQTLLQKLDTPTAKVSTKGFFLYKLQNVQCDAVITQLKHLASKLPSSSLQNQHLIEAIEQIECVPSNNSLLISGTGHAIDQIKAMIAEFDTKEQAVMLSGNESFLIYKPKYLSGDEVQTALTAITQGTKGGGLSDPALLKTIHSARYVEQTNSLIFIGSQPTLDKVQQLLTTIDTSATSDTIQDIENVTFLLYKVQFVPGDQLLASLKQFALQLDQANISNKNLVISINAAKWIKDNNAILFTGNKQTLGHIDSLVKKFDVATAGQTPLTPEEIVAAQRNASSFVIYNPRYLTGEDLITILQDFMQNLQQSGVSDPGLYDAINNLKWINKTSSLLISGNPQAIAQVQQLLTKFDMPQKDTAIPTIESIDNTSFLVYKLQYHPGNDIQTALKQVAMSLGKNSTTPTELVDAIDSLQWIQVTNSILVTGHQDVLVRLKELIQNLDVPLKQVFIEVLIINTSLTNQQNFGLQWGGQVKYLNKTIMQTGNFPIAQSNGQGNSSPQFPGNLQSINGSTFPTNNSIPFSTGFDLGVIGDIIMHKGKSFISLGSLLNALQQDSDSTVILNPKIVTQDNRQSTVFVGQNIPYTGSLVTNLNVTTTQNANIEYRDVGVSLTITPLLGEGDIVTMDIIQDISQVVQGTNLNISATQLTGIQTNHSHMETRVHVPNNHFVALSGMINDTKTHFKTGIPCLGGLPVIGAFFSENDRSAQKNNIIVFVRPQIVTTYQEYKAITEHQEWMYKDSARLPVLKEEFDEGIDLVKIPENE